MSRYDGNRGSYGGSRGGGYGGGRDGGPPGGGGDRNSRYDGGGGGGGNRNGDRGYGNSNDGGGGGGYRQGGSGGGGGGGGGGGRYAEREQGGGGGGGYGNNNDDGRSGYGGGGGGDAGGGEEPAPVKVKQCDDECGDTCDNTRIYIAGLPLDVSVDELRDLFGGIGQVARIKQKWGYKDQWPWNIKIYLDEADKPKGDAVLTYEDPSAAHSAGSFFNDHSLRGNKIKVTMAEKSAPRPPQMSRHGGRGRGGGGGGGGGFRGGGRNSGGPDRRDGGGYRSRPY